jgi:adenylate cyclase
VLFACAIAVVGLALAARDALLIATIDKYAGDLRTATMSPRAPAQRSDIVVVLVNEATLRDYPVISPIDGTMLAELVLAIDRMGPKAIGLDVIIERRTQHTDKLIAAFRDVKSPLVLGAVDDRLKGLHPEGLAVQNEILAATGRETGHLILERKAGMLAAGDATLRLVATPYPPGNPRDSFSSVIARAAGANHEPRSQVISWLRAPDGRSPLFATLEVPRHKPADMKAALAGILPDYWKDSINGRIVLIGGDLDDRDQHPTPLSMLTGTGPGVFIHAQALAQRIDGNRDIEPLGDWPSFFLVSFVTLVCSSAARSGRLKRFQKFYQVFGLALIGALGFAAFGLVRIDLPSGPLMLAWLAGALFGHHSARIFGMLGLGKDTRSKPV